jgi:hypothetical protein
MAALRTDVQVEIILNTFAVYESPALAFNYARMHQRFFGFLRSLLPMSPEIEMLTRDKPGFDTNAVLVHSLYDMEGQTMLAMRIKPDTPPANIPGTSLKEVSRRMDGLIEKEGSFEMKNVRSRVKYDYLVLEILFGYFR